MTLIELITHRLNGDDPHARTTITNAEAIEIREVLRRLTTNETETTKGTNQ